MTLELASADALVTGGLTEAGRDALINSGIDNITLDVGAGDFNDLFMTGGPSAGELNSDLINAVSFAQGAGENGNLDVQLDVGGANTVGDLHITDAQAHQLITHGLEFAAQDNITLDAAGGTHLQTSLKELQKLGIDQVAVSGGVVDVNGVEHFRLNLGAGDSLLDTGLPQFVLDDPLNADTKSLAVSLDVFDALQLDEVSDIASVLRQAGITEVGDTLSLEEILSNTNHPSWSAMHTDIAQLNQAGIDFVQHIVGKGNLDLALAQEISGLDSLLSTQTDLSNIDQAVQDGVDLLSQFTTSNNYGNLIDALTGSGVTDIAVDSGDVEISDPLAAALVDAGMLQALPEANIVIDARSSGDHLFTSLKAIADLGVDQINVGASHVYVNLGLPVDDQNAMDDISAILKSLDLSSLAKPIFGENTTASLVIDNATAQAIQSAGGLDQGMVTALHQLGFNEIDVLAPSIEQGHSNLIQSGSALVAQTPAVPVEVKVIGQADPATQDLHDHILPHK